jgi:hypothetical protein
MTSRSFAGQLTLKHRGRLNDFSYCLIVLVVNMLGNYFEFLDPREEQCSLCRPISLEVPRLFGPSREQNKYATKLTPSSPYNNTDLDQPRIDVLEIQAPGAIWRKTMRTAEYLHRSH